MFTTDHNYVIKQRTSQFFAAQMLTQEWAEPKDEEHRLFKATSDIKDAKGHILVTAYAVLRPDGQWALMLINKDYDNPHAVRIAFHNDDAKDGLWRINGKRQVVYARAELSALARHHAMMERWPQRG